MCETEQRLGMLLGTWGTVLFLSLCLLGVTWSLKLLSSAGLALSALFTNNS